MVDIFTLVLVGKLIEPLWGALEMVTFFFIVNTGLWLVISSLTSTAVVLGVAVLSAFFYYLLYMFTFNAELLFEVHIHGLSGYLAGKIIRSKRNPLVIN